MIPVLHMRNDIPALYTFDLHQRLLLSVRHADAM